MLEVEELASYNDQKRFGINPSNSCGLHQHCPRFAKAISIHPIFANTLKFTLYLPLSRQSRDIFSLNIT